MNKLLLTTAAVTIAAFSATSTAAQYVPGRDSKPIVVEVPNKYPDEAKPEDKKAEAEKPGIKLSKKASKAIIELETAVKANDVANIPAKLAAAQAVAETAEDRYAIGTMQLKVAQAAKNSEAAVLAADYLASANYLPKNQIAGLYNSLGIDFFNAKSTARATAMFQKALALDPNNAESLRLLGETQNSSGNSADAVASFQKAMQQAAASGQKLPEQAYERAVSVAYGAKSPSAVDISRQWVAAYPSTNSWSNAIAIYRNMMRPDVEGTLDLLRLMRAANALQNSADYTLYATAASEQGNYNEAQSVIDEGIANKKLDPTNALARDIIKGLKGKPKATPADLESAAKNAKTGRSMITVGSRFYGTGEYARAATLYRSAVAAGGDTGLANLHLGMALARSGDKAGAAAALNAVSGEYAPIAKYWLVLVQ
ncbi:MAG: tetratricopeptide repeat protein [Sphingomicrobium sp.]